MISMNKILTLLPLEAELENKKKMRKIAEEEGKEYNVNNNERTSIELNINFTMFYLYLLFNINFYRFIFYIQVDFL